MGDAVRPQLKFGNANLRNSSTNRLSETGNHLRWGILHVSHSHCISNQMLLKNFNDSGFENVNAGAGTLLSKVFLG